MPLPCQIATNASRHFVCGWPTNWSAITTAANVWAVLVPGQHILPLPYHPCIISGLCRHRLHAPPSTYHHVRRTRGGACTVHSIVIPPNDMTFCGSAKFALASHHSVLLGMRTTQTAFDYGMHTSCKHKLSLLFISHILTPLPFSPCCSFSSSPSPLPHSPLSYPPFSSSSPPLHPPLSFPVLLDSVFLLLYLCIFCVMHAHVHEHMNGVACMCVVTFLCHVRMNTCYLCFIQTCVCVYVFYMFGLCSVCLVLSGKISRPPRGA